MTKLIYVNSEKKCLQNYLRDSLKIYSCMNNLGAALYTMNSLFIKETTQ